MEINRYKTLWIGLTLLTLAACQKAQEEFSYVPQSSVGKMLVSNGVGRIYQDSSFVITPGVEETDMNIRMSDGYRQTLYLVFADISLPTVSMRTMVRPHAHFS